MYFWNSAFTKLGEGISGLYTPSFNAFAQIFPKGAEAASYDISQATTFQKVTVLAGTWAELVLPALILIGLLTRIAALGMIVFVIVQSTTDVIGHHADDTTIGGWFDGASSALILDQRAFWILLLLILVVRGAGPLSIDRLLARKTEERSP